MPTVV